MSFRSGWYLLYTMRRHEKKVADTLLEREIECYLPMTKSLRKWRNRDQIVETPLFPSYVFVFLKQVNDYYTGLATDGVVYFVRFGKEIAKVSEAIVSNLRQVVSGTDEVEVSCDSFTKGMVMYITEGPLSGMACEVVEYRNKRKIIVRIDLLNRCLLADVPAHHLTMSNSVM